MAASSTLSLCFTLPSLSLLFRHKPQLFACSARPFSSLCLVTGRSFKARDSTTIAAEIVDEEGVGVGQHVERWGKMEKATEVYVFNLPRSCDTEQLLHMFKPHGTILSAEICRNEETGESRGSAYVTMGSINSAKNAVAALDGLDVGGREMRVRFSVEMNRKRENLETMNSSPNRTIYYEGPYKLYVGNLSKVAKVEDLRQLFGRFGNVASLRVLRDYKQGRTRVYAFISYLSEIERDTAISLHGTLFCGRTLVVREGVDRGD
ncbi:small ribosomal subunit protein cS22-like [Gastrolobium bilobum]|uniref:small ribosomal subunit protein cS22-like n=1 Tax=Gastrolobium bilobum TaxID=150636 RepID=UPI002AB2A58B|nr:small ribosomal subunit protein cS22-like [Gastrolobium bilobum]